MDRQNPDKYYDQVAEREAGNAWWRIGVRYISSVIIFLMLMGIALTTYWIWQDYTAQGLSAITWQNFKAHAVIRWQDFQHGGLGL